MSGTAAAISWGDLLRQTCAFLEERQAAVPRLDAELLLAKALGCRRDDLYRRPDRTASAQALRHFTSYLNRRGGGEPLALILGEKEFFSRSFLVRNEVLLPRPETELLVEAALREARHWEEPEIFEVGVGSGAVVATLAAELPRARLSGSDLSPAALDLARENCRRLGVGGRVLLTDADLFPAGTGFLDMIVANLPYIDSEDLAALPREVRLFEPRLALDGGEAGLELIYRLLAEARDHLREDGVLLLEIGYGQGRAVKAVARTWYAAVDLLPDLAGIERVAICRRRVAEG